VEDSFSSSSVLICDCISDTDASSVTIADSSIAFSLTMVSILVSAFTFASMTALSSELSDSFSSARVDFCSTSA